VEVRCRSCSLASETLVVNMSAWCADMRKALSMDADKKSMIPLSRDVRPEEVG